MRALQAVLCLVLSLAAALPSPAQSSGVLLGVARPASAISSPTASRYETLWLVRSKDRPLRARLPDLIVPRATGFWRAGVAATCADESMMDRIDEIWTVKAGVRPVVRTACPRIESGLVPGMNAATTGRAERAALDTVTMVCQVNDVAILFAGPEYLVVRNSSGQTEQCEPRGDRYDLKAHARRWRPDSALTFLAVAGESARSAFTEAIRVAARDSSEKCVPFATGDDESHSEFEDWLVERERGHWQPRIFHNIYGSSCEQAAPILWTMPATFTGHDRLRPSWVVIAARVPGLTDAFTSPNGDMIIAIAADSLLAFESDGANVGARLLAMRLPHERVVMAQWAGGRYVARWDSEMARLRPMLRPARVLHPKR